jgi:hypothetical protein
MGQQEMADIAVGAEQEGDAEAPRFAGAGDIAGGVAAMILLVVLAWAILTMTGALA